ncbi:hypothetical protein YC2023_084998 [Brassica napus]
MRPRQTAEGTDGSDMPAAQQLQVDRSCRSKLRTVGDSHGSRQDQTDSSSRLRSLPAKDSSSSNHFDINFFTKKVANTSKLHVSSPKSGRLNATLEDSAEASRETWDETSPIGPSSTGGRMSHIIQKRVRSEARKVHNLLFDLLKMSFPDTDFREARNALSFSGPTPSLVSTSSPRGAGISQGKRPKPVDEGEPHHDDNAVDARRRHAKHHRHSEVVTSSDSEEEKGGRRRG